MIKDSHLLTAADVGHRASNRSYQPSPQPRRFNLRQSSFFERVTVVFRISPSRQRVSWVYPLNILG